MAAPSDDLLLVLDDKSSAFTFGGGNWSLATLPAWFGGSCQYPAFTPGSSNAPNAPYGSVSLTFTGTSVAFYGNTPRSTASQNVTITIDGNTSYNSSYADPSPQSYVQWYQSPHLTDGTHTIVLENIDGTAVDYAVITAGSSNRFNESTKIIVDDDDKSLIYEGSWETSNARFDSTTLPDGFPFRNNTHQTNSVGDTVTFKFLGTSVAIYGIYSWFDLGVLAATYTIDDNVTPQTYAVTPSTQQFQDGGGQQQNFQFFSMDLLDPSDHTLVINITRCVNLTFSLDYIVYTPTFTSLATMPNLSNQTSRTSSTTPGASSITAGASSKVSSSVPIGAVIGGVIGGTIVLILIALTLFMWRKRRLRDIEKQQLPNPGNPPTIVTPFALEPRPLLYPSETVSPDSSMVISSSSRKALNQASSEKLSRRPEQKEQVYSESPHIIRTPSSALHPEESPSEPSDITSIASPVSQQDVESVLSRQALAGQSSEFAPPAYDDINH